MSEKKFTVGSLIQQQRVTAPIEKPLSEEKEEKVLTVSQQGKTYLIKMPAEKKTLLEAAFEQNQLLDYKCQKGTCGRCEVHVTTGNDLLSQPTEKEREKLAEALSSQKRLACQAVVSSN
ncbi:2Fe-2S iron-sulfur cluster-binding protein [Halalkalibacter urbisdiaboli]|uniref:2Fe-2S iron-sulfur cluster-binding protein n=1 Tax=Halalkalibacter urbisdiaboli TaxID=1960589 RepID=UPI000B432FAE|nr:2Fe-2S iron-sulfur cluster-binding protein [Halalkalibacter urbisdiaboli]